ncbi:hypothetical protein [Polaromonas sp.]|uniref:hypothetical protein n=1 Tax=Polaromonas sp. TaxID=1869339 RepID=UPI002486CE5F|nr:hypothetical protein [Polaromonas sp.]MDI1274482.1 hypothetical protein [Polaromonas sp.]
MNIHQVSVSYVQEQDRLMIRINGKEGGELRAWLTRRLALALLPVLDKTAADQTRKAATPEGAATSLDEQRGQLLTSFQKEAALRSGDFETPYFDQPGPPADVAVGPEPLLLTEVKVTPVGNGQLRLQLFEKLPGQATVRDFQVMMDAQLSNGLLHLLHQGVKRSQWLAVPTAAAPPSDDALALVQDTAPDTEPADLTPDLARPKYLN